VTLLWNGREQKQWQIRRSAWTLAELNQSYRSVLFRNGPTFRRKGSMGCHDEALVICGTMDLTQL
jgi:hypothetical protein